MRRFLTIGLLIACACSACHSGDARGPQGAVVSRPGDALTFAVIGDYGDSGRRERAVAELVAGWNPEIVITLGDNNYPHGEASTIDANVGQYYHRFIAPYHGRYGPGADVNRFFPCPGNHDWGTGNLDAYLDYFELPGNERYYTFTWGPVDFFALDSDDHEPDGVDATSAQARWLESALAASHAPWKVVYLHHPPYSSGPHGPERSAEWPYHAWGADVVMSGHDHIYERIERPDGLYFVNGLGGSRQRYPIEEAVEGSALRFNARQGAMRVEATPTSMRFTFITARDEIVDTRTLTHEPADAGGPPPTAAAQASPSSMRK